MKLAALLLTLAVFCVRVKCENAQSTNELTSENLLKRAALQLERLSAFRRTRESEPTVVEVSPNENESQAAITEAQRQKDILEAQRRIDDLRASASAVLRDPKYAEIMQDRIKRSFISGVANKLIGGAVGAASGLSRGAFGLSSSNTPTEYGGYGHPYENQFTIFDIKKAIINTLIQAFKAIGGGAIAGGGALVKGGGYLVTAKGRLITTAGDAIQSIGKALASSAIIAGPKPVYGPPGYSYDHHTTQYAGHDAAYDGPPPSADAYAGPEDGYNVGHSSYASPSNDDGVDNNAGILIVKETKPGHGEPHEEEHPPAATVHETNPNLSALEESFGGGPPKESSPITKIIGILNSGQPTNSVQHNDEDVAYYPEHKDHQSPSSGPSLGSNYESGPHNDNHDSVNQNNYQSNGQIYDSYGTKLQPSSPQLADVHTEIHHPNQDNQQSLAFQIQAVLNPHLEVPKHQEPTVFKDPASFADYHHHGNQHQSEPLKIPILDNSHNNLNHHLQDHQQFGSLNYYGLPSYGSGPQAFNTMMNLHADSSSLPMFPQYNYPLNSPVGFGHDLNYPETGGPAVLGVWGRMTRRTSDQGKKAAFRNNVLKIQRSIGYAIKNAKLIRI